VGAAAPQVQALDDVDAIEFDLALGDRGQVPSPGRWRPADAPAAVEGAAALEDPSHRAHGRHGGLTVAQQGPPDRRGPEFAEIARRFQFMPNLEYAVLDVTGGPASMVWPRGATSPLHVIQRPMSRARDPELYRGKANAGFAGHLPERLAAPHRRDEIPPPPLPRAF